MGVQMTLYGCTFLYLPHQGVNLTPIHLVLNGSLDTEERVPQASDLEPQESSPSDSELQSTSNTGDTTSELPLLAFTDEEVANFNRKLDECCDVYSDRYTKWLQINHPDALPTNTDNLRVALSDQFEDILPLDPLDFDPPVDDESEDPIAPISPPVPSLSQHFDTLEEIATPVTDSREKQVSPITTPHRSSGRRPLQLISNIQEGICTTPTSSLNEPQKKVSPIAQYLQVPTNTRTKPSASSSTHAVTGARVLTSGECLALIREKEQQKKRDKEAKANRKKIREEKKIQREEEKLRKAEERAKKQEEKTRKADEREEMRARKAEEKSRKEAEKRQAQQARQSAQPSTSSGSTARLRSRQII